VIDAAVALLRAAEKPLVIAGGGVRYSAAETALARFASELGIPVSETSAGKGSLDATSEWLAGGIGVNGTRVANELAREADVVVCVGTRLSDFTTGSHSIFQHDDVRFIGINVNAADANKLSAHAVVADAREALDALREALMAAGWAAGDTSFDEARIRWQEDLEADIAPRPGERIGQGEVLRALNRHIEAGDWVVAAAGWQPGDLLKLWETPPGSFTHIEFAYSCMGHEIPAGLGIRLREGAGSEVFVVIGDGTYLMSPTELVTAAQEGLKVTVVVLDNGGYQSISRLARGGAGTSIGNEFRSRGEGRWPQGEPLTVDYVANARSMGVDAMLASTVDEFAAALTRARAGDATTVIVVPTEPGRSLPRTGAFWDLGVPEAAAESKVLRLTAAHLRQRADEQRTY
jgi:3D-(3,5/4)-trihydroxycyclohexane-1,2-dione acylhydrolase (decyclizing)